jgi:hypothetical protein
MRLRARLGHPIDIDRTRRLLFFTADRREALHKRSERPITALRGKR